MREPFYIVGMDHDNPYRRFSPLDVGIVRMPGDMQLRIEMALLALVLLCMLTQIYFLLPPLVRRILPWCVLVLGYRTYRAFFWHLSYARLQAEVDRLNQELLRLGSSRFALSIERVPRFLQRTCYRGCIYNMKLLTEYYQQSRQSGSQARSISALIRENPSLNAIRELLIPVSIRE